MYVVFPAPFVEEAVFSSVYVFGSFVRDQVLLVEDGCILSVCKEQGSKCVGHVN
jgi:hypothetical protein